jgi:hypothetical protein
MVQVKSKRFPLRVIIARPKDMAISIVILYLPVSDFP